MSYSVCVNVSVARANLYSDMHYRMQLEKCSLIAVS